ncbi:MAG: amidohydrolase family protein [Myxococcota bacterium]
MLDLEIRGARIVDGSGRPQFRGDVGVLDGRIVSIRVEGGRSGTASAPPSPDTARERIDADGLVLAPGFIDPHTHYDAQLAWDPTASPSNLHGVTTVIGGNCGFSIAPLGGAADADYLRRMLAVVEGMPLEALERGLDWGWRSFADFLALFEGRTAVNAGFLVGHCALRRTVMGERGIAERASQPEIAAMGRLLQRSLAEGGLGLSSSRSFTHRDGEGRPVPSRAASEEELLALCAIAGDTPGTSLEFITDGCLQGFKDEEIDLMARMSLAAGRPLNWNVFTIDASEKARYANQLRASQVAAERGARVVALTMPTQVGLTMSFLHYCALHQLPGWGEVMALPVAERIAALRRPEVRQTLLDGSRSKEAGVFASLGRFGRYRIGETFSEANRGLSGRMVGDLAAERGKSELDTLLEVVLADDLRTVLWPQPAGADVEGWSLRATTWGSEHVLLGGSDAGAHLDRMCGAPYTTDFLADCLRGRRLWPLERAVAALSDAPARLFGLKQRGRIEVGHWADLVLFDPETVGSGEIHARHDLPGGTMRLFAASTGIARVFVNGRAIVADGAATDALPGRVLRSGRDTETVAIPAARASDRG